MKVNLRKERTSNMTNSVVSGETKTYYYKKGDTVVIHSNLPFTFDGCTKDRIYKYEKIDHGLGHSIEEFKQYSKNPIEWIVTVNALFDLKVVLERNFLTKTVSYM